VVSRPGVGFLVGAPVRRHRRRQPRRGDVLVGAGGLVRGADRRGHGGPAHDHRHRPARAHQAPQDRLGAFSQRAVAVYEHFIAELTEQVLDECPASEPFDFVDAVAKQVPIRVLAWIMGLPAADLDLFIDLRVSRFELTGEPRRIRSNFTNGLKTLPVRVFP
jgi:cytochrome P450